MQRKRQSRTGILPVLGKGEKIDNIKRIDELYFERVRMLFLRQEQRTAFGR